MIIVKKPDNVSIRKKFGENLRALRKARGYSQMKFAEIVGTTQAAISAWELGLREPEFTVVFDIAEKFGVPASTLIPLEESGRDEDITQRAIDLLHQNPRLCVTFDKTKYFNEQQMGVVMSVIDAISKESDTK